MFLNIKYAYSSLLKQTLITILSIIQLSICFVFLYFMINQGISTLEEMKKISTVLDNKQIYSFKFRDEMAILNNEEVSTKSKEIYEVIKNNYSGSISFYNDEDLEIESFHGMEQFVSPGGYQEEFSWVRAINVDENFIRQFNFDITDGRIFDKNDFLAEKDSVISAILGSEYEEFFKVGDIISYRNRYGGGLSKIKVIGFMESNSIFISDYGAINLDSYIIYPVQPIDSTITLSRDDNRYVDMFNFLEVRSLRDSIITVEGNDNIINSINDIIKEKSLSDNIYLKDLSESQYDIIYSFKESIYNQFIGVALSIIFVTMGLIFNSLNKVKSKYIEFGVHINYGCKIKDIFFRILFEFIILSLISFVTSVIFIVSYERVGGVNFEGLVDYRSLFALGIFSIILGCIIALPSAIRIKNINITELIRR